MVAIKFYTNCVTNQLLSDNNLSGYILFKGKPISRYLFSMLTQGCLLVLYNIFWQSVSPVVRVISLLNKKHYCCCTNQVHAAQSCLHFKIQVIYTICTFLLTNKGKKLMNNRQRSWHYLLFNLVAYVMTFEVRQECNIFR